MTYKFSRYNMVHKKEDGKLSLFNGRSGAVIEIDEDDWESLQQAAGEQDTDRYANEFSMLEELKIVYADGQNELQMIEDRHVQTKYEDNLLVLTILPTLACNLNCVYCYEDKKPGMMPQHVRDNVVQFVENQSKHVQTVEIIWIGGEALLAIDAIADISERVIQICDAKGIAFKAGLVTNAYRVSDSTLDILEKSRIGYVQITLDGPKEIHDKRRVTVGQHGTFDYIYESMQRFHKRPCFDVTVRVNVDNENAAHTEYLMDQLERDVPGINVTFDMVVNTTSACADYGVCMTNVSFAKQKVKLLEAAMARGLGTSQTNLHPTTVPCGAVVQNNFVVNPDGTVCKCWHEVGHADLAIGFLNDEGLLVITKPEHNREWLEKSPLLEEKCRKCEILPLCMGGCPWEDGGTHQCPPLKFMYKDILRLQASVGT